MSTPDRPAEVEPFDEVGARTLVVFLVACHLAQAVWIIAVDRSWPYLMTHQLYMDARRLHGALGASDVSWFGRTPQGQWPIVNVTVPWPPLVPISTHLASKVLDGMSRHAAAAGALPWIAVLLLATYRLGRQLASPRTGLLAALLVGSYPIVLGHRTMATPFLPLAAQIAALAGAIHRLDRRPTRWARFEVGLWAGLALLTRLDAPVHIGAVVAVALVAVPDAVRRRRLVASLAWSAGVAVAVGGWWYLPNGWGGFLFYRGQGLFASEVPQDKVALGSLTNLCYYPVRLVQVMAGLPMAALAVGSAIYAVWRRVPHARHLVAWVSLVWVFYVLVPMKGGRYVLPLVPPLAVCTAVVARELARRGARAVELAIAAFALVQWLALVHAPGMEAWYPAAGHRPERWGPSFVLYEDALDVGRLQPWTEPVWDTAIERLARAIDRHTARRGLGTPTISIADEISEYVHPVLQVRTLRQIEAPIFGFVSPPYPDRMAEYLADIDRVDFLVMTVDYTHAKVYRNRLKTYAMRRAAAERKKLVEVLLPDGTTAVLLGRR